MQSSSLSLHVKFESNRTKNDGGEDKTYDGVERKKKIPTSDLAHATSRRKLYKQKHDNSPISLAESKGTTLVPDESEFLGGRGLQRACCRQRQDDGKSFGSDAELGGHALMPLSISSELNVRKTSNT